MFKIYIIHYKKLVERKEALIESLNKLSLPFEFIDKYDRDNLKDIESDMNACYKSQYTQNKKKNSKNNKDKSPEGKTSKTRRKRQELSISASKSLSKTNVKVIVSFD